MSIIVKSLTDINVYYWQWLTDINVYYITDINVYWQSLMILMSIIDNDINWY